MQHIAQQPQQLPIFLWQLCSPEHSQQTRPAVLQPSHASALTSINTHASDNPFRTPAEAHEELCMDGLLALRHRQTAACNLPAAASGTPLLQMQLQQQLMSHNLHRTAARHKNMHLNTCAADVARLIAPAAADHCCCNQCAGASNSTAAWRRPQHPSIKQQHRHQSPPNCKLLVGPKLLPGN